MTRRATLAVAVAAVAALGPGAVGAHAGVHPFNPVADASVSRVKPRANFGKSKRLVVSPVVRTYLRFNVRGLGGAVSYATLQLTAMNASGSFVVRRAAANSWREQTIRFKNAPRILAKPVARARGVRSFRTASVDVTNLVRGPGVVTFVLVASGRGSIAFASGETKEAILRPRLVVGTNDAPECLDTALVTSEDSGSSTAPICTDTENDRMSYEIVDQGAQGKASIVDGRLHYTPNPDANGPDRFTYRAKDARKWSQPASASVLIRSVNDAPVCEPLSLVVDEDGAGAIGARCSDIDGDGLTYSITSGAQRGNVSLVAGELRYTPNPNTNGSDSFTYRARDTTLTSAPVTVSVIVRPVNDAPTCGPISITTDEDTAKEGDPSCSDIDGDALAYAIVAQGSRGSASVSGGKLRYTPAGNLNGPDLFTYLASDGAAASASASVSVDVAPVNDAPVCQPLTMAATENGSHELHPECLDVDNDTLTYQIDTQGLKGVASIAGGTRLRYVANAGVQGPTTDSFTYRASDGPTISAAVTVAVTIEGTNDPPTCAGQTITINEDSSATITPAVCTDPENDLISLEVVDQPMQGTATAGAGGIQYTPAPNANGSDTFTFRGNDATLPGPAVAVSVTIVAVNDAPVCQPLPLVVDEDTAGEVSPSCSDVDGDPLSYSIVSQGTKGNASVAAGKLRYVPILNVNGADSFAYRAHDALTASAATTVSVTIGAVNDAPVCSNVTLTTLEDTQGEKNPACTDVDGDPLTYAIVADGSKGAASVVAGRLRYDPDPNANGADSFTYRANDGVANSAAATASVTITPVNDAPTCSGVALATSEDTTGERDPACADVDGNPLTYSTASPGSKGAASVVAGKLRYVPNPNAWGSDSFTYQASDGALTSAVATVSVTIAPVNDAPVCAGVALATDEDVAGERDPSCTDVEGDPLGYSIASQGSKGTASVVAGTNKLRYAPNLNANGTDSFTYRANDGAASSAPATVSVTIAPVNDVPVCAPVGMNILQGGTGTVAPSCTDIEGTALSYSIVSQGSKGVASVDNNGGGPLRYVGNQGAIGPDSFTYRASDGALSSAAATVSVDIGNVNDAPVCQPRSMTLAEDSAGATVAPSCTDADGDPLSYSIVADGGKGTATVVGGQLRYVPDPNANGADTFTYAASDGALPSAAATVTVTITPVNDAPSCSDVAMTTNEDTLHERDPACSDIDGNTLTYSIVVQATKGTASIAASRLRYVPNLNANGTDSFTYQANDGTANSNVVGASVTITPVNDVPTCSNVALSTNEDVPGERDPSCSDVDGDALTYSIAAQGTKGTASVGGGKLRYAPSANANGSDSFTYTARDGALTSAPATVSVTINAVNDAPVCADVALATSEDAQNERDPSCTDVDSATLTYSIASPAANGTASVAGTNKLRYVPNANANGTDSFTYLASDGALTSAPATVSVTITPVNDAPVCSDVSLATNEDAQVERDPVCSDIDGNVLTYSIVAQGSKGTASVVLGRLRYVPDLNVSGADSFTYRASDGVASSPPATASVTVAAVNDAPVCNPLSVPTDEDGTITVAPSCTDVENDALTYSIATNPTQGTASVDNLGAGPLRYVANPNATGGDSFTYRANDGNSLSAPATVTIEVLPVNDPPVCDPRTLTLDEDAASATVAPSCADPDLGDTLTYSIVPGQDGTKGTATVVGGQLRYIPDANANGSDTFQYRASDGALLSVPATVSVTIGPVNDAPVCSAVALTTDEDLAGERDPSCADVDGDALTYSIVAQGNKGTASIATGKLRYVPSTNANGTDSFTYRANDGIVNSLAAPASVTITPVNDAPVCQPLPLATNEDVPGEINPSCSDIDGDALSYSIVTQGTKGSASIATGRLRYAPAANLNGADSFTYRAHDAVTTSAAATVSVTIAPVNDAPTCTDRALALDEDTTAGVAPLCADLEGDPVTFGIVTQATKGTASVLAGELRYAANLNANGADSFTYRASDGSLPGPAATVSVTIRPVNDAPVCIDVALVTGEDAPGERDPSCSDVDGDGLTYSIAAQAQKGTASISGSRLRYTPNLNVNGSDSFTYSASDGALLSSPANVAVTIVAVNDAPVCVGVSLATNEDASGETDPSCSDVDGNPLSYSVAAQGAKGTASVVGSRLRFVPSLNANGPDTFSYRASDGALSSSPADVSVAIAPVNDAPTCSPVSFTTNEDVPGETDPACTDIEGDALSYAIVATPTSGTASVVSGKLRYVPNPNTHSSDSFTYRASDGGGLSSPAATASVTINPVNDAPVCANVPLLTTEDVAGETNPSCSDVDGDALTYAIATQGTIGTASVVAGKLRYVPNANVTGTDSFTYTARDASLTSSPATVSVSIGAANDAPACSAVTLATTEDTMAERDPSCTDVDGDALTYSIDLQGAKGTASVVAGKLRYVPNANANGTDSFTYRANDGVRFSAPATVTVTIAAVNDRPVCADIGLVTDEDLAGERDPSCTDVDGDALTVSIFGQGTKGTASMAGTKLRYVPHANLNGTDIFTYRADDGAQISAAASVTVELRPVNDVPACTDVSFSTDEDVLGERDPACTDIDGDALTYSIVLPPARGTASVGGSKLRYLSNLNANGTDSFTYRANDGSAASVPATASVTIAAVNDAPACAPLVLNGNEDSLAEVTPSCSDVEGDAFTHSIVSQGTKGTASLVAGKLRYVPQTNANGIDSFTYRASDAALDGAPATVSVTIAPVNDAPVCSAVTLATDEDVAAERDPSCSDIDGDSLTYSIAAQGTKGTASVGGGKLRYAPSLNLNGADSFTYRAHDASTQSAAAPVSVTIAAVNDVPACPAQSLTIDEDSEGSLTPVCTDPESDPVSLEIVETPLRGSASVVGASLRYVGAANTNGPDSFTYRARDSQAATSAAATVSVTIRAVNDAPVCATLTLTTLEDTAGLVDPSCTDIDAGDSLSYSIAGQGVKGQASVVSGQLRYAPNANANGADSFTYAASDGVAGSNAATVNVNVAAVNDAPAAQGSSASTAEDTAKALALSASDVDDDPLTYTIVSQPANGVLSGTGSNRTYTPAANYFGPDSFTFRVNDGLADSNVATVSLSVTAVNDPPVAQDLTASTPEDTAKALVLSASDVEGSPLTFTIVAGPTHGSLSGSGANRTYTPATNYNGPDSFTYKANDGTVDSNVATVTLTVDPANDAPVCPAQSLTIDEDGEGSVTPFCVDTEGDPISLEIVGQGFKGSASVVANSLRYAGNLNANGSDSFTYRASDGASAGAPATVSVAITPVNDAPTCSNVSLTTNEDAAGERDPVCGDVDGDPLSYLIASPATNGTASVVAGRLRYTPNANYNGADTFSYQARDALLTGAAATVSVTVAPANDAPTCAPVSLATNEDVPGERDPACTDIDGDALSYSITSPAANGTASVVAGKLRYAPNANFHGSDSFSYQASDAGLTSGAATVSVTVAPVNDAPVCADVSLATDEDVTGERDPACSDVDGDALTYAIVAQGTKGTASVVAGRLRYAPNPNVNGADSFTYRAGDTSAFSVPATVTVSINPLNDAPVCADVALTTDEDVPGERDPSCTDIDGGVPTYSIVSQGAKGTASVVGGRLRYAPNPNENGSDSFTYRASDGAVGAPATVSVTINPVNDAPFCPAQSMTIGEDSEGSVTPLCLDPEGDALSLEIVDQGLKGNASVVGSSLRYVANVSATGSDSFTYRARDAALAGAPATVSVTITPVNDAPVCADVSLATNEDTAGERDPACTDVDSGLLTYFIAAQGTKGSAAVVGGRLRYTPNPNVIGSDSFTYRASDGTLSSAAATVSVTITAINDAPSCADVALTTDEDVPGERDPACSDVDGDALTYTIVTDGTKGSASVGAGKLRYAPNANLSGADSFTYRASDGLLASSPATVSVTIVAVNDAPTCADVPLATNEDVAAERDPSCTDIDSGSLTYSIAAQGAKGTASVVAGRLRYVPNANANGADSFTYRASDAALAGAPATVSVTIAPANDAPTCAEVSLATDEDVVGESDPACADIDGDGLTYTIVSQGSKGTASVVAGRLRYTPNANATGTDSFTYRANDESLPSGPASVSVTIAAVNDAPTCADVALTTDEGVTGESDPFCTDVEGETLTYSIVAQGTKGQASVVAGKLRYVPDAGATGADSFTYRASDGSLPGVPATVAVTINATNDAPTCANAALAVTEDMTGERDPSCTDPEGDPLTYSIVAQGVKGTASVVAGRLRYAPQANANGTDSFTYRASDGELESAPATVSVTITPVNDGPVCPSPVLTIDEDTDGSVIPACIDPETDPINLEIVAQPLNGTAAVAGNELRFVPNVDANGNDSFTYRGRDGSGLAGAVATVSVTVRPVNDEPEAIPVDTSTPKGVAKVITLDGFDYDNDPITFRITSLPANGIVRAGPNASDPVITAGSLPFPMTGNPTAQIRYEPNAGFTGVNTFEFVAHDGAAASLPAEIRITVVGTNVAPVCSNRSLTVDEDTELWEAGICSDADGDPLTFTKSGPSHGQATIFEDATFNYVPDANYNGPDSLTVIAQDPSGLSSAVATITITVNPVNDAPVCRPFTLLTTEDTPGLTFPDCEDVDLNTLTYTILSQGTKGTASVEPDGRFRYVPSTDANGADSFTFTVSDGVVTTAAQTAQVSITAANDAPTCNAVSLTTPRNTPGATAPACQDVDGNTLTYEIVTQATNGTASVVGSELRYSPAAGYAGPDSFTYRSWDGTLWSGAATVSVTVTP